MEPEGYVLTDLWRSVRQKMEPPTRLRTRLAFVASLLREEPPGGAGQPRLLWRDISGAVGVRILGSHPVVIGRSLEADVVVPIADVSRRHCRVGRDARGAWVEDLGSRHGTKHNGVVLEGRLPLADGDTLELPALRLAYIDDREG
jgi:hypothetical protein